MSALEPVAFRASKGAGLEALERGIRADLETLNIPGSDWVRPRVVQGQGRVLDVAIIGGGQSGLGAAFALMKEGVVHVALFDENPAGLEGPWVTYARMLTLRTPKHLTSVEGGVPSLTFRAWWEAQYGEAGWAAVDKIPRQDWMAYLRWFRQVLGIQVRNTAKVTAVDPVEPGLFRLTLGDDATDTVLARKVIFATGIQGGGEWHTPDFVKQNVPRALYAHTSEAVDFEALRGKRIAILGGGASAFDNAQHALGAGVAEAHVFIRRKALPKVNPIRQMEVSGMIRHTAALDDAAKYAVLNHFLVTNQPPTNDTYLRAAAYPGFRFYPGSPWLGLREENGQVFVRTPAGEAAYDFLILSTGMVNDTDLRPELTAVKDDIALWSERYRPPEGQANPVIDRHPYLGPGFEYQGRTPEGQARLHGLFSFNYSALASMGLSASALSGLKVALPKLAAAVAQQLFLDDKDALLGDFFAFAEEEFKY